MREFNFVATESGRVDAAIAQNIEDISRSYAQQLIEKGLVFVNGKGEIKSKLLLNPGDKVVVNVPPPVTLETMPEEIPLSIVYEDEHLLVVSKPRGMVVHPAAGNGSGTLVNALLKHCHGQLSEINGVVRPGIVHRIDKDTTGLLLVAKDNKSHIGLAEQIKAHSLTRQYIALVHNNIKNDEGTIETTIGRHPTERKKMSVHARQGRVAITHYKVLARYDGYTLVQCRLETGRTHQIRVQMSYIGNPLVGDKLYGIKKEKFALEGQLLHAQVLGFIHPITNQYMEFSAPLPEDFLKILKILKKKDGQNEKNRV